VHGTTGYSGKTVWSSVDGTCVEGQCRHAVDCRAAEWYATKPVENAEIPVIICVDTEVYLGVAGFCLMSLLLAWAEKSTDVRLTTLSVAS